MTTIDDVEYLQDTNGSHSHSNSLLKKQVRKIEDEYVRNAAANPTIASRTVLSNILQNQSLAAASSMSRTATLEVKIYRERDVNLWVK